MSFGALLGAWSPWSHILQHHRLGNPPGPARQAVRHVRLCARRPGPHRRRVVFWLSHIGCCRTTAGRRQSGRRPGGQRLSDRGRRARGLEPGKAGAWPISRPGAGRCEDHGPAARGNRAAGPATPTPWSIPATPCCWKGSIRLWDSFLAKARLTLTRADRPRVPWRSDRRTWACVRGPWLACPRSRTSDRANPPSGWTLHGQYGVNLLGVRPLRLQPHPDLRSMRPEGRRRDHAAGRRAHPPGGVGQSLGLLPLIEREVRLAASGA